MCIQLNSRKPNWPEGDQQPAFTCGYMGTSCSYKEVHRKYHSIPLGLPVKEGTFRRNGQSALAHFYGCVGEGSEGITRRIHSRKKRQVIWTIPAQPHTGKKEAL